MILTKNYSVVASYYEGDYYLWIYQDGSLEVDGPFNEEDPSTHAEIYPGESGAFENMYRVRYDEADRDISVIPPYRRTHNAIPESLVTKLMLEFPDAEYINGEKFSGE